ncbi:MAG TPA: glycine cleavage system protein GcvH [Methylophilaceae bacterium]|nr:glycine cleavage system protein GcvH [Methylophilaceae bacterium]
MKIQENLLYSAEHLWIKAADDGQWLAGITDYAQDLLGDIVYVEPPAVGTELKFGLPCGLVESVKTGSDLHAPLDGTVTAINEELQGNPEQINDAPYSAWIFKFKPQNTADTGKLLDAQAYQALLNTN